MPTGYTHELIKDPDMSAADFIMRCSRAMGALIMIRDDDSNAPIPERFEPSDYHDKELEGATKEHNRLLALTPDELIIEAREKIDAELTRNEEWLARERKQNETFGSMLIRITKWEPPSEDHKGLKEFILDQLKTSIDDTTYIEQSIAALKAEKPEERIQKMLYDAEWNVNYHADEGRKERERTESRNKWLKQLRESLPE
jgi:hypothetical protein